VPEHSIPYALAMEVSNEYANTIPCAGEFPV
jgi:hypothetical protein